MFRFPWRCAGFGVLLWWLLQDVLTACDAAGSASCNTPKPKPDAAGPASCYIPKPKPKTPFTAPVATCGHSATIIQRLPPVHRHVRVFPVREAGCLV